MDICIRGLPTTRFKDRTSVDAIFGRLDRVVTNEQWLNLRKDTRVENLLIVGSDHGPNLIVINSSN